MRFMSLQPESEARFREMRETAERLFRTALGDSTIAEAFDRHLDFSRGVLRISQDLYQLDSYRRVLVVSMGKGAHAMAHALAHKLGAGAQGIVAGSTEQAAQVPGFRYFAGGHPVPNAESLRAAECGFAVDIDNSCDDWDYARAADHLLERLRDRRRTEPRLCLISGGEVTVEVKEQDGTGGRNQHFALYCAQKIAGENITVLSAGPDGIDGNSIAAGAVVDGSPRERARVHGLDPARALARFDSHPFFRALGDALVTGPTGNNLRDLRILLAW